MKLNIYMGFNQHGDSQDGAVLIFARGCENAKVIGWNSVLQDICGLEYSNVAIRRLGASDHLYAEADQFKLKAGEAHVIDNPKGCRCCLMWGSPIGEDGLCESCREQL